MATFPFMFNSRMSIIHERVVDKVNLFFTKSGVDIHSSKEFNSISDIFDVKVDIDNTIISVWFWMYQYFEQNHHTFICFYDYHELSETLTLNDAWENLMKTHPGLDFDDGLILLVVIKDDGQNKEIKLMPQLQKPNFRCVEWSANSSEQDTRRILEDFVRMVVIKEYYHTVHQLHEKGCVNQDEDRQFISEDVSTKANSWSMDFGSLFSMVIVRYFDLYRIVLCYCFYSFSKGLNSFRIFWKCPSEWSHLKYKSGRNTPDNKLCYFEWIDHTWKLPVSSPNNLVSIFVYGNISDSMIQSLESQQSREAEIFGRSLLIDYCRELDLYLIISRLKSLHHLVIFNSFVHFESLVFPTQLCETLKHLVLTRCGLTEVPHAVGSLIQLTLLDVSLNHNIHFLPVCLGNLRELRTLLYEDCPIKSPPKNVLRRSAREVVLYLRAFQVDKEIVPYNQAKLIVAGQEGVGKSTLIKGMDRNIWAISDVKPPEKTDGVEIKTLQLEGTRFLVYDLAGDVEYHNTHPLFLSSECLYLVVFDMSQIHVGKGARSVDQLCRLELWLQMIASQQTKSYVIIVGTHADHERITAEILKSVRRQIVDLMEKYRSAHKEYFDRCILCNEKLLPEELQEVNGGVTMDDAAASESIIPHVLGYFEVSSIKKYPPAIGFTNKNLQSLKSAISSSNRQINEAEFGIPKLWRFFYEKMLENKLTPTVKFSEICSLARESEVPSDMIESMLRFFHSQGNFVWYEDIPEMREVVITDPNWLSDKLRTLISYRPSVNAVCDGILHSPSLSEVWPEMTEENRQQLLALFRSVGLCFSISDEKELFPCNLPIGWPDKRKWHSLPKEGESQTSLLFNFTFLPPTFFPKLIIEVNKKRASFPANADPLYYRFHIYYDTLKNDKCDIHSNESKEDAKSNTNHHKVHYEIMPHKNSMKVSIRGPSPCCIVSDVCSTIKGVHSSSYPGVAFHTHLICPLCEMEKENDPGLFSLTSTEDGNLFCLTCREYLGSIDDTKRGKYKVPQNKNQVEDFGKIMEDYHCPKLFVVLPINIKCSSLKDRFVYSYLKDGYAVHLLCECPDQWHFVNSPGFRIAKPKEFLEKYGKHLCTVMKAIGKLGTPLRAAAAAEPLCKTGAAVASGASSIAKELEGFLFNAFEKYPQLNPASYRDLEDLRMPKGLQRSELAKFLETVVNGREFGPLMFTYVDKSGEWLWLCEEHNRRFTVVNK
ncbi:uncharacterized protein LOC114574493 [Exaiptasia diaphana]|uniref:non-specific serine/threonine protein kinase n=1 Tax=Exaiptasia diaphana TaxID=2652724 RepID=A0A913YDI6_EXADI|nr:uncharacterized protein LOC114574493 [Exaiptasia diaphana]